MKTKKTNSLKVNTKKSSNALKVNSSSKKTPDNSSKSQTQIKLKAKLDSRTKPTLNSKLKVDLKKKKTSKSENSKSLDKQISSQKLALKSKNQNFKKMSSSKTSPIKNKKSKALVPTRLKSLDSEESSSQVISDENIKTVDAEIIDTKLPAIQNSESSSLVSTDPLTQYLAEIRKYPLLTPEEEKELAIRYYENKDSLAAEKLVTSNLRFVVKIALEYAKMGAKLMDVIQEGNVGLMHAVKEYNPYKGVKLITYAVWWIRGYIREYLMKQFSMVKIGTTQSQKKLFYNLEKQEKELKSLGQEPKDVQLISSRLGVSEKDVEMMQQRMSSKDVSLDAPLDDDGRTHLGDLQTDHSTPEEQLEVLELIDILKDRIEELKPKLNEKELDILENRILADEPQTLQEIGERYGISRERARQLEERVLKNIKEQFLAIAQKKIETI